MPRVTWVLHFRSPLMTSTAALAALVWVHSYVLLVHSYNVDNVTSPACFVNGVATPNRMQEPPPVLDSIIPLILRCTVTNRLDISFYRPPYATPFHFIPILMYTKFPFASRPPEIDFWLLTPNTHEVVRHKFVMGHEFRLSYRMLSLWRYQRQQLIPTSTSLALDQQNALWRRQRRAQIMVRAMVVDLRKGRRVEQGTS